MMRLFWHDFNSPQWGTLARTPDMPLVGDRVILRDLMGGEFEVSAITREVRATDELGLWWVGFDPDPDHTLYHYLDPPWPKEYRDGQSQ